MVDVGRAHLGLDARDRGREVRARVEEDAERGRERAHAFAVEAGAAQPTRLRPRTVCVPSMIAKGGSRARRARARA